MDRRRQGGHRQRVAVGMADVGAGGPERVVDAHHVHLERALHHRGVAAHERQLRRHARVGHDHVEPAEARPPWRRRRPPPRPGPSRHRHARAHRRTSGPPPRAARARGRRSQPGRRAREGGCARAAPMPRAAPVMNTRRPSSDGVRPRLIVRPSSVAGAGLRGYSAVVYRPPPRSAPFRARRRTGARLRVPARNRERDSERPRGKLPTQPPRGHARPDPAHAVRRGRCWSRASRVRARPRARRRRSRACASPSRSTRA